MFNGIRYARHFSISIVSGSFEKTTLIGYLRAIVYPPIIGYTIRNSGIC